MKKINIQKKGETQMQKSNKKTIIKPVGALSVRNTHEKDPIAPSKNHRGITLIALIITIIVMIILVGVTINVALNGGLFETTEKAAKGTQIEADREILQVGVAGALVSEEGITKESLQNNLPEGWNVNGEGPFTVISPNGNKFTVNLDGTIETNNEEDTEIPEVEKVMDEYPGDITDNGTRDGTESNPYMINSMEDLVAFGELVDMGETYEGKIIKLGYNLDFNSDNSYINPNDPYTSKENEEQIDINENGAVESIKTEITTGKGFNAIGELELENGGSGDLVREGWFKGTFDGNGKTIDNFYFNLDIETMTMGSGALFGTNAGIIKNLGVKVSSKARLQSGLVAINGDLYNPVTESGVIENSYCEFKSGSQTLSGISAMNIATIKNCYTNGKTNFITFDNDEPDIAKICLQSEGIIKNCYSSLEIGTDETIKPLVGRTQGLTIENCYNLSGSIVEDVDYIPNGVQIRNCYATGNLVRNSSSAGGIVENYGNHSSNKTLIIDNCYYKGRIDLNNNYLNNYIDGLVGGLGTNKEITNSKYLEKSLYVNGELQPDDENAATEEEMNSYMKSVLEVVNGDGAFKEDTNNINNGYPILSWQ